MFVTLGGGQLYTYGPQSMVDAQMKATGLTTVFGDATNQRDIETSLETILGKDPDVLILLTIADLQATKDSFLATPGVDGLDKLTQAFGVPG